MGVGVGVGSGNLSNVRLKFRSITGEPALMKVSGFLRLDPVQVERYRLLE